jgi:hypothetical protein
MTSRTIGSSDPEELTGVMRILAHAEGPAHAWVSGAGGDERVDRAVQDLL